MNSRDVLINISQSFGISRQIGSTCQFYACYKTIKRDYGVERVGNINTFVGHTFVGLFNPLVPEARNLRNRVNIIRAKENPINPELMHLKIYILPARSENPLCSGY